MAALQLLFILLAAAGANSAAASVGTPEPSFPSVEDALVSGPAPPGPPPFAPGFVSHTLGSNMVLQRAPKQAVLWGFAPVGTTVTTRFNSAMLTATADASGVWRQQLPATPASGKAYEIGVEGSNGEAAILSNILFGDVYLCGGQSNMQFSMPAIANVTAEVALADKYPHIRLFTVGQKTSAQTPLSDLATIEQNWTVASHTSVAQGGRFGLFSAVCWIFGREVFDGLGGEVPIGLINNNWGGTPVEHWSTPASLESCGVTRPDSTLYNSMINPYTVGPMALTGFTWYQGEANTHSIATDKLYECTFPAMIQAWRKGFANPNAYFGFIQLSTWCSAGPIIAQMRQSQMAAVKLPMVGYGTNADHGAGCNIHPPPKQYCGKRLANSAMALQYGKAIPWRSPTFKSQVAAAGSVTITLNDVSTSGLTTTTFPFNYLGTTGGGMGFNCTQYAPESLTCAWAALTYADGTMANATVAWGSGGLVLSAPAALAAKTPTGSAYAWGAVPMMSLYDASTGLPVLGWNETVAVAGAAEQ